MKFVSDQNYKVEELKTLCRELSLKVSGNKKELINRICESLNIKPDKEVNENEIKPKIKKGKKLEVVDTYNTEKSYIMSKIVMTARHEIIKNTQDINFLKRSIENLKGEKVVNSKEIYNITKCIEEKNLLITNLKIALNESLKSYNEPKDTEYPVNIIGQKIRKHVIVNLIKILHSNTSLNEDLIKKYSIDIENGIYQYSIISIYSKVTIPDWKNDIYKSCYVNRSLLIINNLNPQNSVGNKTLLPQLISGELDPYKLGYSTSSKDIFPERNICMKVKINNEEKEDGILRCPNEFCKSMKTEYKMVQLRSGDEASDCMCLCLKCGNRWKLDV